MSHTERHEADRLDRDKLQTAVALWPKLPSHGPFCACLDWNPTKERPPCDCDHSKRNEARAQARHLLGMDP